MMAPVCNTGVHPPSVGASYAHASRFDWYRATVPAHHQIVIDACCSMVGEGVRIQEGPGRFNYKHATTILDRGDRVATVLHGGSNGSPNVEASGNRAPALAELLRSSGPHKVTRCDVAIDFYGDTVFSDLEALAVDIGGRHHGLDVRKIASLKKDPTKGETVYIGSRSSTVFARIYEKGKADAAMYLDTDPALLRPWVRCELEVKPAKKEIGELAATMAPDAFWGISEWTRQLASEAFDMAPDPIPFHPRRGTRDDIAFGHMCRQYGSLLRRRCSDRHQGDRARLLAEIEDHIFGNVEERDVA